MGGCTLCGEQSERISDTLGLCSTCILADTPEARAQAAAACACSRQPFLLPARPPRASKGVRCERCVNTCKMSVGQVGFCGIRRNEEGRISGGEIDSAVVQWYHDPLPTNCVADWVCAASGPAGHPPYTDTKGPEHGYSNLAVFYEACSFNCLFCQNWHFRQHSTGGPRHSAAELAAAVDSRTRCICFFGGDPSCQVEHALATATLARGRRKAQFLRVCWETNGSVCRSALKEMGDLSLASGGCIKFDIKAWDDSLHHALCGVTNRRTLENFEYLSRRLNRRPDPPLLVASTLLVPGYVDAEQVSKIATFIARLGSDIPYALLAFHPAFAMRDLPITTRHEAERCLAAAEAAGLTRVRVGNLHLLA